MEVFPERPHLTRESAAFTDFQSVVAGAEVILEICTFRCLEPGIRRLKGFEMEIDGTLKVLLSM